MGEIILIHGAWHGAWCWNKVLPLLQKQGHKTLAPDLPGHGSNRVCDTAVTLDQYTDFICDLVDKTNQPVTLVGHSMSGIVISRVAEIMPEKINKLIFVSGFLLKNGQTILEVAKKDTDGMVLPNLVYSRNRKFASIREDLIRDVFYQDCTEADYEQAKLKLTEQSLKPLSTPISISAERCGKVAKSYIACSSDRAISYRSQLEMITNMPCEQTITLDSGHSPFISMPELFVNKLLQLG